MPQIFVFPAGNEDAQRNLGISMEKPVPATIVFDVKGSSDQELKRLERIRQEGNGFYAWGAQPSDDHGNEHTWEAMQPGDYVLAYYRRAYHYVARGLGKYHDPELARAIWDEDADGNTWEYMYFLTEPVKIDAPTSWVADSLNLTNKEYRRFCRIDPKKKMLTIVNMHGSVQNFIDRLLQRVAVKLDRYTTSDKRLGSRYLNQESRGPRSELGQYHRNTL